MDFQKLLILLFIITITQCSQILKNGCGWKNDQGIEYDLSPLQKATNWQIKEDLTGMGVFNMVYVFNFCGSKQLMCNQTPVSIYEALEVYGELTDNCDIIGKSGPQFSNIDNDPKKGLKISFTGGDACFTTDPSSMTLDPQDGTSPQPIGNQYRQATFLLECANHNDANFTVDSTNQCNTVFKMKTQVGCKGGMRSHHSHFKTLLYLSLLFSVYVVGGYLLNKKQKGLEGVEALPHLEQWRQFPSLTLDGIQFSMQKSKKLIKIIRLKIKNRGGEGSSDSEGYTTI